jgi:hypothetical protein
MRPIVCPRCNGKGKSAIITGKEHLSAMWYRWQECSACNGSGYRASILGPVQSVLYQDVLTLAACLPKAKDLKKTATRPLASIKL